MGYDAVYAGSHDSDDAILARLATDPRWLVTRDVQLHARAARRGLPCVFIPAGPLEEELAEVLRGSHTSVDKNAWFTRCTACNGVLVAARRDEVERLVPPGVRESRSEYVRCSNCNQVYWRGSHVEAIEHVLEAVRRRIAP